MNNLTVTKVDVSDDLQSVIVTMSDGSTLQLYPAQQTQAPVTPQTIQVPLGVPVILSAMPVATNGSANQA